MQKKMMVIELGIADDIKAVTNESNAMLTNLDGQFVNLQKADAAFNVTALAANKANAEANKAMAAANKLLLKIGNVLEKADKAAKELGVAPNSVAGYDAADKIYVEVEKRIQKVNGFNFPIAAQVGKGL